MAYKQDFTFLLDPFIHYTENPQRKQIQRIQGDGRTHRVDSKPSAWKIAVRKIQLKEWLLSHAKPTR